MRFNTLKSLAAVALTHSTLKHVFADHHHEHERFGLRGSDLAEVKSALNVKDNELTAITPKDVNALSTADSLQFSKTCSNWQLLTDFTGTYTDPDNFRMHVENGRILMYFTDSGTQVARYSDDQGATWKPVAGLDGANIKSFSVDSNRILYVVEGSDEVMEFNSADWENATPASFRQPKVGVDLTCVAGRSNFIVISGRKTGLRADGFIQYTTDGGTNWMKIHDGIQAHHCAMSPDGQHATVIADSGVPLLGATALTTKDGGQIWNLTMIEAGKDDFDLLTLTDTRSSYGAKSGVGIWRSAKNWFASYLDTWGNGLPEGAPTQLGAVHAFNDTVYITAKDQGFGLLTSHDSGVTWAQALMPSTVTGLFDKDFHSRGVFVDGANQHLYAVWQVLGDFGLWRADCTITTER